MLQTRFGFRILLLAVSALFVLAACGSSAGANGADGVIKVGASPVPHADILRFVRDNLAEQAGLTIEIVEFTDYVQPNVALNDGQIEANFFQHVPYMEEFASQRTMALRAVAPVHIEAFGIYSRSITSLADVQDGAVVTIPNDATNGGRALQLLAANGLLTLKDGVGTAATVRDITANPKNLDIRELEAAQLPRALDDAALSIINGNYAIEAGLTPSTDALALESGTDNPYANVLAVIEGHENDADVQALAKLLQSPEVKQFISETYQGAVVPAF